MARVDPSGGSAFETISPPSMKSSVSVGDDPNIGGDPSCQRGRFMTSYSCLHRILLIHHLILRLILFLLRIESTRLAEVPDLRLDVGIGCPVVHGLTAPDPAFDGVASPVLPDFRR